MKYKQALVSIIVIAFFIISCLGFMMGDDYWMNAGVTSLLDLVKHTGWFYLHSGGRLFSVTCQYLFSGVLGGHRIWYAIANTLFFVVLIVACGKLVQESKQGFATVLLSFALLFWFLCPVPKNTLFWIAGSPTYMWANTLSFVFLWLYLKYRDDHFGVKEKLGLFVLSFLAASEYITCAAISGALVVYYAFHIKKLKGNAVPFVIGFILGSMVLLFAPGSLRRVGFDSNCASILDVGYLVRHPVEEFLKYRALWLFLVVLVWGWIRDKGQVKQWMKDNAILLLSLGWSVIAFSVVFRPIRRASFFPETLSIVLFLKFLVDHFGLMRIRAKNIVLALLFAVFVVDAVFAMRETVKQRKRNDAFLSEIVDAGGIVALDQALSSHRMAYAPIYYPDNFRYIAQKLDLDTVCVYPHYCLDKYYDQDPPLENVYVAYDYYADDADVPYSVVVLTIRVEEERLWENGGHIVFTIDCANGKTFVFEREEPRYIVEGYGYYPFYFDRKDAKTLRSVESVIASE